MVLGESAKALTSFTSARFSFSQSGGRDGRLCRSSVQRIDSNEAPPSGIEASSETSFCNVVVSLIFHLSVGTRSCAFTFKDSLDSNVQFQTMYFTIRMR